MTRSEITVLLDVLQRVHAGSPGLWGFAPWPENSAPAARAPAHVAAVAAVCAQPGEDPVLAAVRAAAPHCTWLCSHRDEEVGAALASP
jgi:hypothetical protein